MSNSVAGLSQRQRVSRGEIRALLSARLHARRPEIEELTLTRIYAVSSSMTDRPDPEYLDGLRAAVAAALDFGFAGIARPEQRDPKIPPELLAQARTAARADVTLDTVLRRYFAGYSLLCDFVIEEAEAIEHAGGQELKRLLRAQAARFDHLVTVVSEEHASEVATCLATAEDRRAERVQRLLNGELADVAEFAYDFDSYHVGAIVKGPGASAAAAGFASDHDCRRLTVRRSENEIWIWLGARRRFDPGRLLDHSRTTDAIVAVGEPAKGTNGWRLSHQQAKAALAIARRMGQSVVRYGEVAVLASVLQDDILTSSLREFYLVPLEDERDGGEALRETLRAYFAAQRNASSAAAALGVSRRTIANRLQTIEERIGRPISSVAAEIELALRLLELTPAH